MVITIFVTHPRHLKELTQKQYDITDGPITLKHLCHHGHDRITLHSYLPAIFRYIDRRCDADSINNGTNSQYFQEIPGHRTPKSTLLYKGWSGIHISNSTSFLDVLDIGACENNYGELQDIFDG